jgi:2,4-diaminopentanoate dehydrogenase
MSSRFKTLAMPDPDKVYRVVQWATGVVGSSSLRAIIRHPKLQLVGHYVHSEAKEGRDSGELCGLDPVGITATRSIDDIVALKPDCVLYMQEGSNIDDLCRLLAAGINIVTTRGDFHFPPAMDPEIRRRTEEACRRGATSIYSTGSSPGFITEAVPAVLTSIARRLDCLTINEYADIANTCSEQMIFDVMGYGKHSDGKADQAMVDYMVVGFGQSLAVVADALGLSLDSVQGSGDVGTARNNITLPAGGVIEKSTVAAQRVTVEGMCDGRPLLRFRSYWYCSLDLEQDWELRETGWRVVIEGDTPMDVHFYFPRTTEDFATQMSGYTAHRAVNAVPYVCAAEPGIHTTADLPQIFARLR